MHRMGIDAQIGRYLGEQPLSINDVIEYSLHRDSDGLTTMTLKVIVDSQRFDAVKEG